MNARRTATAPLVVGERATGTTRGPGYVTPWSGVYVGERVSEHDGVTLMHMFRDGDIGGVAQAWHGFPVDTYAGTE